MYGSIVFWPSLLNDKLIWKTSALLGRKFTTFNQMIVHNKRLARRSLLVEDGTANLRHLWLKDDENLNGQLFDSRAESIIRWRIDSNGSIQGGPHSKRFFLVQFCDDQHYDNGCQCKHLMYVC